jgi:hypothetical protein
MRFSDFGPDHQKSLYMLSGLLSSVKETRAAARASPPLMKISPTFRLSNMLLYLGII